MQGTIRPVNKALSRPLLIAGVEKRLFVANALLSFPLVAATHFHVPWCFIGVLFFMVVHAGLTRVSKADPMMGTVFKRSTRWMFQSYYPANAHPFALESRIVKSVSRPW